MSAAQRARTAAHTLNLLLAAVLCHGVRWCRRARIVICGQISTYNSPDGAPQQGPRLLHHLLWQSARMSGFLVQDYETEDAATYDRLCGAVASGSIVSDEDVMDGGLSKAPAAFLKLFSGANAGKQVVRISQIATQIEDEIRAINAKANGNANGGANKS
jgi:hypothetical protein